MAKNLNIKFSSLIVIFIFTISLAVIPVHGNTQSVIIGGEPFGLKLYCKGVMVTKFENFSLNGKSVCPGKDCGLMENDIITQANKTIVKSNEQLGEIVSNSNGHKIILNVIRNNEHLSLSAFPSKNEEGIYCLGIWVRDSCAGIGTITYYNPDNYTYGALGHGICDIDTGGLMVSDKVEILSANISSVTKSESNKIGTLNGFFTNDVLAKVGYNSDIGIYGKIMSIPVKEKVSVGTSEEIEISEACIYSTLDGSTPKKYDITITEICSNDKKTNKNFIFQVTDQELLSTTGGIVQGMSGSPIIQNNKIIGAVTHVMINDPTKGYGIQIENMLNCNNITE